MNTTRCKWRKTRLGGFLTAFCLSLASIVNVHGQVVLCDSFEPSLKRSWWWNADSPEKSWEREVQLRFEHDTMFFRFFGERALLDRIEIRDTASDAIVFEADNFDKSLRTPSLPKSDYKVICSGKAGKGRVDVAVTMNREVYLLPSWSVGNAKTSHIPGGGISLVPENIAESGSLGTRIFNLMPGHYYTISLDYGSDQVTELFMRRTQRIDGRRVIETDSITSGVGDKQNWIVNVASVTNSMDVFFQFSGECRFHALTISEVSPPDRRKVVNDKTFTFEPRNPEPEPPNPNLDKPMVFRRPLRQLYESSIPQPFEMTDLLSDFATPGEYAVWDFALHNPGRPRRVELLTVSDLDDGQGNKIPSEALNISQVKFWDFPRGTYTYHNIPELIEPQEEVDLSANANHIFWIQSRIPENTMAGAYTGTARLRCGDTLIELGVRLRVLPFKLLTPTNMVWSAYSRQHVPPQSRYPEELSVRYLKDIADYGVTSLNRTLGSEAAVRNFQRQRRKAGLNGPVIVYGIRAEVHASKRCGVEYNKRWFDNPKVRQAFVDYIKEFDGWFRSYGGEGYSEWYYMGADEPHIGSMETSHWQNRLAREAGVPTAAAVYAPRYVDELSPWLNLSCNMFISRNPETHAELQAVARGKPLEYWYLGGGSYVGQEGGLMPNRLDAGFMSFKLGVTGHKSYTYQTYTTRGRTDPYDNFSAGRGYGMTYPARNPTAEKVTVSTLSWEGIREGIIDYKYLYTLEELEKQARDGGFVKEADAARRTIDAIIDCVPWRDDRHYVSDGIMQTQTLNNDMADKLRGRTANAILDLMEVLQ